MDIRIKGFIESSCSDWPGQVVAVIFLPGCNFRCPYCHNYPLVLNPDEGETFTLAYVFQRLAVLRSWLDGVCVSGGEPTLSAGLAGLCGKIKEAGLLCKLDTNGSRPRVLQELLAGDLIDFVAMDVKAPLLADSYERCAGVKVELAAIRKSMEIIRNAGIAYQFRTTYHPALFSESELEALALLFYQDEKPLLQKACPSGALSLDFRRNKDVTSLQFQEVTTIMRQLLKKNKKTEISG
ncbi:MAG: anaerobic ribonucleoside-triphosphate reductase activating protein [Pseudomonadota bacterium]|nr:anaerobic ribonucleoside-triphosphate reductase activating protein [Pseudomonadota bacterium]